ncbi:uncharacterized protein LOC141850183 [Brevipalpus obovatus]|uniref:uncharacterized protein LOC141850183 n=1 Tax=Brevipalpus obovatus TaxID=246614 RepID=UPI003D9DD9CA
MTMSMTMIRSSKLIVTYRLRLMNTIHLSFTLFLLLHYVQSVQCSSISGTSVKSSVKSDTNKIEQVLPKILEVLKFIHQNDLLTPRDTHRISSAANRQHVTTKKPSLLGLSGRQNRPGIKKCEDWENCHNLVRPACTPSLAQRIRWYGRIAIDIVGAVPLFLIQGPNYFQLLYQDIEKPMC